MYGYYYDQATMSDQPPKVLDKMADIVLKYRPKNKPKLKAKKRPVKAKKEPPNG